ITLPGGMLLSNVGLAMPWVYPTYRFGAWVPWLVAAVVLAVAITVWRRRDLARRDVVGAVWPYPLVTFALVAVAGYFVASADRAVPAGASVDYAADRGRGTVYRQVDGTREPLSFTPVRVRVESAQLRATSQNLVESRRRADS